MERRILLRRECYFAVGGFAPERDVDEDWELLLNVVAHGFDLQVIPEAAGLVPEAGEKPLARRQSLRAQPEPGSDL